MKIGIKFCGGCNPRYDRRLFLEKLKEKLYWQTFHVASLTEQDDVLLCLCGCKCACADIKSYKCSFICLVNEDHLEKTTKQLLDLEKALSKMTSFD